MANVLINPSIIAQEALFQLENNTILGDRVYRKYKKEFVKIGDTVTIRRPVKFVTTTGATRSTQDVHEPTTSITIDQRKHVSWLFSSQDLTLTIEEYSERYIKPAMIQLANAIDVSLATEGATKFFNGVGTPGTDPATFATMTAPAKRMDNLSVPDDGNRQLVLNPNGRWSLAAGLGGTGSSGVFNAEIVGDMVRSGYLGNLAQFYIYGDQNIQQHTVGAFSGTILVNGVPSTGVNTAGGDTVTTTVLFDGAGSNTAGFFLLGDIVSFASVFSVNPVSFQTTGELAQFVVTADVTTASAAGTLLLKPAMNDGTVSSFAGFQNVTALPADNAAITVFGTISQTFAQNLAFHKNALALVTVPLELPDSAVWKARADWRGYSIRVIKDYDIDNDEEIIRLDILYGVKDIYPELGVRVAGA